MLLVNCFLFWYDEFTKEAIMEFIRARSDEQKNIRLNQIVSAALELYETTPFDKITLAAIAKRLDFTRANLYKYVSSKEEIYLLVISSDLEAFVQDALEHFKDTKDVTIEEFAWQWSKVLYRHERLLQLFSVLFTLIEKNVSVKSLAAFKRQMFIDIGKLEPMFLRLLPGMDEEQIILFLNIQLHYVVGLYPSTNLNDIQQEAIQISEIPYKAEDFISAFARFLTITLKGLLVE